MLRWEVRFLPEGDARDHIDDRIRAQPSLTP
jgi:hypothetical protein